MYRVWAWRAVQCVTCSWWAEEGGEDGQLQGCDCGWARAWLCVKGTSARPLSHSWHHESRLELGIHEHLPDDHAHQPRHPHLDYGQHDAPFKIQDGGLSSSSSASLKVPPACVSVCKAASGDAVCAAVGGCFCRRLFPSAALCLPAAVCVFCRVCFQNLRSPALAAWLLRRDAGILSVGRKRARQGLTSTFRQRFY